MRILITGGLGYIGSHLRAKLCKDGKHTYGVIDDASCPNRMYGDVITALGLGLNDTVYLEHGVTEITYTSLSRINRVMGNFKGYDAVVHLAAKMPKLNKNSPTWIARMYEANVFGIYNALSECRRSGVPKFIFTSSAAVYGNQENTAETNVLFPVSEYGFHKLLGEENVRHFNRQGLNTTVLRLFNVYGPYQRSAAIIPSIYQATKTKPVQVFGGQQIRDFIYIDDVVNAIIKVVECETNEFNGQTINIGTGVGTSIKDLVELYEQVDKQRAYVKFKRNTVHDDIAKSVANTDLMNQFQFKISTSLKDGLSATLKANDITIPRLSKIAQPL